MVLPVFCFSQALSGVEKPTRVRRSEALAVTGCCLALRLRGNGCIVLAHPRAAVLDG